MQYKQKQTTKGAPCLYIVFLPFIQVYDIKSRSFLVTNMAEKVLMHMGFITDSHSAWPQGYKTFFMLNSAEHEIFTAYKC